MSTIATILMEIPRPPTHADLLRALHRARLEGVREGIDIAEAIHNGRREAALQREIDSILSPVPMVLPRST